MQLVCIHSEGARQCQKPAFTQRTNGWLCLVHYRQQQLSMPAKPRLPQPRWKGLPLTNDDDIVADIIATDRATLGKGKIVPVRFGSVEPSYVRYHES